MREGHYSKNNDIPPRLQWEANHGYCGEVSLISAGLYYGQYASQYEVRRIASEGLDQSEKESQLLLGVNASQAATYMRLRTLEWRNGASTDANGFLAWVKQNVITGYPVVIGVYMNQWLLDESASPDHGHPEYDHIVPVTGISSSHPLAGPSIYYPDDVIRLSDNGLWSPSGTPAIVYRYAFGAFQVGRQEANSKARPIYSLARTGGNYGIAITGIIDRDGKTLPVRVATDLNFEKPAMREGSGIRPPSRDLMLTVTVSGLRPGIRYNLYRYDRFEFVPEAAFNAKASVAAKRWQIELKSGSSYSIKDGISSKDSAIYRAVPEGAP